jgi:PAS domain S-box-containing protein
MVSTIPNWIQLYFDLADVFMVAVSRDELVIDVNKVGCKILGYAKVDVVGKNWFDNFLSEATRDNSKIVFHEMLKGSLTHVHSEQSIIARDGKQLVINWHNVLVKDEMGSFIGVLSSGADVTDRRRAEEAIKKTENRLQSTLDSMLEGCQIIDFDFRYVYLNDTAAKQARRRKEELLGQSMMEMFPGIDRTKMFSHLVNCMNSRVPHEMENEFTYPDRSKGWFETRIEPVPEGVLVFSIDITRRKEYAAELSRYQQRLEEVVAERASEFAKMNQRLTQEIDERRKTEEGLMLRAMILDNAREAIFLVNKNGDFVYANEAASRTYGYSRDEFLNMNLRGLLRPQEAPMIESRFKELIEKGQLELETVHVRKDKSTISVQVHHSLVKTLHGEFIVSVIRVVTGGDSGVVLRF